MRLDSVFFWFLPGHLLSFTFAQSSSPKRGLIYIPSSQHPSDDQIWIKSSSPPTWYYNYKADPSTAYENRADLQFVPMLWGAKDSDTGTPFYDTVKRQLDAGKSISYVLAFNEPDGSHNTGGSNLPVDLAAKRWKAEIEPLKKLGVKVGAPAVTGAENGWTWMQNWLKECDGGCNPDFVPVHWYGNFEGMMSHVGRATTTYPKLPIWITEFGYPHQNLKDTQAFYNQSVKSFDSWPNVTHYSYFGAFRSSVSNVGPNAAFLTSSGNLTDIGSWYLGGAATHNIPSSSAITARSPRWLQSWQCIAFALALLQFMF